MPLLISGKLSLPITGRPASNAEIRFRAVNSVGEIIQGAESLDRCDASGNYNISLEFARYEIATKISTVDFIVHGQVTIDIDTIASDLESLIEQIGLAGELTDELIKEFQQLKAETVAAASEAKQSASEAAADAKTASDAEAVITPMYNYFNANYPSFETNYQDFATKYPDVVQKHGEVVTLEGQTQAAKDLAERWASNPENVPVTGTEYSAFHWAEKAKQNANQTFVSGGLFTPAAGNEYPDVSSISRDTIWIVEFSTHGENYTFTSGQLSGKVTGNGDMMFYDTPNNTWSLIPTAVAAGIISIDGDTGPSVNLESKYYWSGNAPSVANVTGLQSELDTKATIDHVDSEIRSRTGIYKVGNISAYVGQQLQESERLNSYQYPDDSDQWYGPVKSQAFPITIPADPTVHGSGWAVVNDTNQYWISENLSNKNLIANSDFSNSGSVENAPDATPRSYSAGDELFQGFKALGNLSGVTYVNGKLNGTGQLYVDVYKTEKQKLSTVTHVASIASSDGLPVESGASFVDNADYWRVTFDMNETFSVKLEQGSVATRHETDVISYEKIATVNTIADMRLIKIPEKVVYVSSESSGVKFGSQVFLWDEANTAPDNGTTIIKLNEVNKGRYLLQFEVANDKESYLNSSYASSVKGRSIKTRNETETSFNRPVAWAYNLDISPPSIPGQITDFHGMDIYGKVGDVAKDLDLSTVRNYLFESKASYTGSGKLGACYGGFFEANNFSDGELLISTALRLWSRNQGNGSIGQLCALDITKPSNNGQVSNAYGIKIGSMSAVGVNSSYAIYSDGGDVTFNKCSLFVGGSVSMPYAADNSIKIKQSVSGFSGEIIPFSSNGATEFNVTYTTPDPESSAYNFKYNGAEIVTISREGKINAKCINFSQVPTNSSGLSVGDVWNDGGTLKIVS